MKKIILILAILFIGCGYSASDYTKVVVVTDIESDNISDATGCYYYTRTTKRNRLDSRGQFYDACGKYTVGDTVKITKR